MREHLSLVDEGKFPVMIMPSPNKAYDKFKCTDLKNIWQLAKSELIESDKIYACGFSFRDFHFNQLLAEISATRKNKLTIEVINKKEMEGESIVQSLRDIGLEAKRFHGWLEEFIKHN